MLSASGQDRSPSIRAVGRALPPHYASQEQLIAAFRELWATRHFNLERLEDLHRAVQVGGRHLALPLEAYPPLVTFQQRNDAWIRSATELGETVVRQALDAAELTPGEVDHVFFVTVTGIATPSIDARLANRVRFREDFKRTPLFGLGCVAGAAGVARAADYLRGFPEHTALVIAVELCSLTLQREDLSIPNIIASGLFGDGAACAVLRGAAAPGVGLAGARFSPAGAWGVAARPPRTGIPPPGAGVQRAEGVGNPGRDIREIKVSAGIGLPHIHVRLS